MQEACSENNPWKNLKLLKINIAFFSCFLYAAIALKPRFFKPFQPILKSTESHCKIPEPSLPLIHRTFYWKYESMTRSFTPFFISYDHRNFVKWEKNSWSTDILERESYSVCSFACNNLSVFLKLSNILNAWWCSHTNEPIFSQSQAQIFIFLIL